MKGVRGVRGLWLGAEGVINKEVDMENEMIYDLSMNDADEMIEAYMLTPYEITKDPMQRTAGEHVEAHLMRQPTHKLEVTNTGMPAELIIYKCYGDTNGICDFEVTA